MPSWNNKATANTYAGNEYRFKRTRAVAIAVSNAPIFAQFAVSYDARMPDAAVDFQPDERDMANGSLWNWTLDDFPGAVAIVGVRVRSELLNTPAIVTIHAG